MRGFIAQRPLHRRVGHCLANRFAKTTHCILVTLRKLRRTALVEQVGEEIVCVGVDKANAIGLKRKPRVLDI